MILVRDAVLVVLLIIITYTDLKRMEIDNEPIVFGLWFIAMFSLAGLNAITVKESIVGFLVCGVLFTLLAFGGMGGGDIKLMAMIGFFLGWKLSVLVMMLAFCIGAIVGIVYMLVNRKGLKQHIPFGPSIAAATLAVLLLGPQILNSTELLWMLR